MKFLSALFWATISLNCLGAHTLYFDALDIFSLHSIELKRNKLGLAPRYAERRSIELDLLNDMSEYKQYVTSSLVIQSKNAVSINLSFKEFLLSESASIIIWDQDNMTDPLILTSSDNNIDHEYWTPIIESRNIMLRFMAPKRELHLNKLVLGTVNLGFRTFSDSLYLSGSCNIDVSCSEGDDWQEESSSVAVISTGGSTFCTGFMVNNTRNDNEPLFMTADHCGITHSNARSLVVYWNYQASSCGGDRDGAKNQFTSGATFLASSTRSDFTIVRLSSKPDDRWGIHYAGWDRSDSASNSAVAIHHPSTDEKSISFENDPTTITSYIGNISPGDGTHIKVSDWDYGTTEPGSSGSPLFDQNKRVIGQLHGGYASCSSRTADWYGRIYTSWEGERTPQTRLKDWLDPDNTGAMFIDTL